jgi:hypothetical protein
VLCMQEFCPDLHSPDGSFNIRSSLSSSSSEEEEEELSVVAFYLLLMVSLWFSTCANQAMYMELLCLP